MPGFESEFNQTGFQKDRFGVITGTYGLSQFPDVSCSLFRLKAPSTNVGLVSFGNRYNTGTTSLFMPWRMAAGDDTGWNVVTSEFGFNLNEFYQKGSSGSSDRICYWVQV